MIPAQTTEVLAGSLTALVYTGAVAGSGLLCLAAFLGHRGRAAVRSGVGLWGLTWLGFVMGQGILGLVWLGLSLLGGMRPWVVGLVGAVGWLAVPAAAFLLRKDQLPAARSSEPTGAALPRTPSWSAWVAVGIAIVCVLRGAIALLPPEQADALKVYLVMPLALAASGSLQFQAFAHPYHALVPLQVELHWAALFAVSNETAVAVWDYVCALGFLGGTALLARSLTASRRAALVAVLLILSTPGFSHLMGGGKVDNAGAQYGIAAFVGLALLPTLGGRAVTLAGLFAGWALASRYTDVIIVPALAVFAILVARRGLPIAPGEPAAVPAKRWWARAALAGGVAAAVAGVPMLIKNWLLAGAPLAPAFGGSDTFWAAIYGGVRGSAASLTVPDLFVYPFVWTFAERGSMAGNISPLFLGLVPVLLLYRGAAAVRPALAAGLAGLIAWLALLLLEPLFLYTRWFLVPLALWATLFGAALVELINDERRDRLTRWSIRGAIIGVFFMLLFDARGAVHGLRYLAAIDSRAARYDGWPGHDVALWLNGRVQRGERVALGGYRGFPYFLQPEILLHSESRDELQWLWERGGRLGSSSGGGPALPRSTTGLKAAVLSSSWSPDVWQFHVDHGFRYVVVASEQLDAARGSWNAPRETSLELAFQGRSDAVLRIAPARTADQGGSDAAVP